MTAAEVDADQDVVEGELVDEQHQLLPALSDELADYQVSARALARVAAATPFNTVRVYAREVLGRKVVRGAGGRAEDAGPAGVKEPDGVRWAELAWVPWCHRNRRTSGAGDRPATAESLTEWASELVDNHVSASTIQHAIYAVRRFHKDNGHKGHPDTGGALSVVRTYRRDEGGARQKKKAKPLTVVPMRQMLRAMPRDEHDELTALGLRDSVVLLLGVLAMLRRSELAALRIEHVTVTDRGVELWIAGSKTDKESLGEKIVIPRVEGSRYDVVDLVRAWLRLLAEHGFTSGPLLRAVNRHGRITNPLQADGQDVDRIVKASAVRAGLDPKGWSGHSCRAGGATAGYEGGASYSALQRQGRWKSLAQLLEYIRAVDEYKDNAAAHIVV
jgi:integrase